MDSVLDSFQPHRDVDSKIVAGLERLAHVFRWLLWEAAKEHGLSPLQVQFLTYFLFHTPEQCRVNQLAHEFNLTPATVSETVKTLEAKGLITRRPWEQDRRVSLLVLTSEGHRLAQRLSNWADAIREQLALLPTEEKVGVLQFLMRLIAALQRAGIITVARMCITCAFFEPNVHPGAAAPHHCRLLNQPLSPSDLRVDCPDYMALPSSARGEQPF